MNAVLRRVSPPLLVLLALALAVHLGMVMSPGGPALDPSAGHTSVATTGHGPYHAVASPADDDQRSADGMHLMAVTCLAVLVGVAVAVGLTDRRGPLLARRTPGSTRTVSLAGAAIPPPTPLPSRIEQGVLLRT